MTPEPITPVLGTCENELHDEPHSLQIPGDPYGPCIDWQPITPVLGTCQRPSVDRRHQLEPHPEGKACSGWLPNVWVDAPTSGFPPTEATFTPQPITPVLGTCESHVNPRTPHEYDPLVCVNFHEMLWPITPVGIDAPIGTCEWHDDLDHQRVTEGWVEANAEMMVALDERDAANLTIDRLTEALRDCLKWMERKNGGDPSLDAEEYYATRDYARSLLRKHSAALSHPNPEENPK